MATSIPTKDQRALLREDAERLLHACTFAKAFSGKTVAVTGASGMLGGWVTYLLTQMHEIVGFGPERVLVLASGRADALPIWSGLIPQSDIHNWSPSAPAGELPSADIYVHLASPASPRAFISDPQATVLLNTVGTLALLERARTLAGARVLFVSSSEIYGLAQGQLHEDSDGVVPLNNHRWIYAEAKRLGELLCQTYAAEHKVESVIARPFHTLGPGMNPADERVFGEFIRAVLEGEPIVLRGEPSTERTFCYAADAALGLLTIAVKGESSKAYNLAGSSATSIGALAAQLSTEYGLDLHGNSNSVTSPHASSSNSASTGQPDIGQLTALGWRPEVDAFDAFRRTINYARAGDN